MTTITTLDKQACRTISDAAREALEKVAGDLGLSVKIGGGSYDPGTGTFSPKITFALPDADRREFDRWAEVFGLEPEHFGKTFVASGKTFTVTGIRPKARKRPVRCHCADDGKDYTFPASTVRLATAVDNTNPAVEQAYRDRIERGHR